MTLSKMVAMVMEVVQLFIPRIRLHIDGQVVRASISIEVTDDQVVRAGVSLRSH